MPSVSGLSTPCGSSGIHDYTTKIPSNHKHWKWKWKILPPGDCRWSGKRKQASYREWKKPKQTYGIPNYPPWGGKISWGKAIVYHPWHPDLLQLHQAASDMHETAADLLLDALSHAFGCWPIVQNTRHSHCCLPIIAATYNRSMHSPLSNPIATKPRTFVTTSTWFPETFNPNLQVNR